MMLLGSPFLLWPRVRIEQRRKLCGWGKGSRSRWCLKASVVRCAINTDTMAGFGLCSLSSTHHPDHWHWGPAGASCPITKLWLGTNRSSNYTKAAAFHRRLHHQRWVVPHPQLETPTSQVLPRSPPCLLAPRVGSCQLRQQCCLWINKMPESLKRGWPKEH